MAAAPLSMGLLCHSDPPVWHPACDELKKACREAAVLCEKEGVNISSLAIVFALAQTKIPCTLLGMKNREQVKVAVETANRLKDINSDAKDSKEVLEQVLSDAERRALSQLRDSSNGPFANVWKSGNFRWDGAKDGRDFWKQVEGAKAKDWQQGLV